MEVASLAQVKRAGMRLRIGTGLPTARVRRRTSVPPQEALCRPSRSRMLHLTHILVDIAMPVRPASVPCCGLGFHSPRAQGAPHGDRRATLRSGRSGHAWYLAALWLFSAVSAPLAQSPTRDPVGVGARVRFQEINDRARKTGTVTARRPEAMVVRLDRPEVRPRVPESAAWMAEGMESARLPSSRRPVYAVALSRTGEAQHVNRRVGAHNDAVIGGRNPQNPQPIVTGTKQALTLVDPIHEDPPHEDNAHGEQRDRHRQPGRSEEPPNQQHRHHAEHRRNLDLLLRDERDDEVGLDDVNEEAEGRNRDGV